MFFATAVKTQTHLATRNETVQAGCSASQSNMGYFISETHVVKNRPPR